MNRYFLFFILALFGLFASCSTPPKPAYSTTFEPKLTQPKNREAVKVKISTGAQRVYLTEGDEVLLASPCSVGKASTPTPKGEFKVLSKKFDRRRQSSPGAGYPMTYWMSFYSPAYGMHWGFVKPYPCTAGCVRLPIKTAKEMFDVVSVGTPVIVAESHPEDQTHGRDLPVLDDSSMPDPPNSYLFSPKVFEDAKMGKLYTF